MASEITVTPKGYTENPDLLPVPASERAKGYSTWTFTMMIIGNIGYYIQRRKGKVT